MSYGVTADGFVTKSLEVIKAEIEDDFKAKFGNEIDLSPQEPFGQLVGIMAEREAALWDLAQATYAAAYPDSAEGDALVEVCAITGTVPLPPTKSTVVGTLTGTPTTIVPEGSVASVQNAGTRFATLADATIAALTAWAGLTSYSLGARRTNGGNVYVCIATGTSAASGGPTTEDDDITDGTAHWRFLGSGTGAVDVEMEAEDYGPKVANSGTLNVIETAVAGWAGVINVLDADPGRDAETDTALRLRRLAELDAAGSATVESIRSELLKVDDVDEALVFENPTDTTDGDGLPPHSIECVVRDGDADDIRAAIFASKAAGIQTYGGVTGTVEDSQGFSHEIDFSRPTEKDVYLEVDVTIDPDTFSADGVDQIKAAIVEFADAEYQIGDDVIHSKLDLPIWEKVSGILDVTEIRLGFTASPTGTANLAIGTRELALMDTSRIVVTTTP